MAVEHSEALALANQLKARAEEAKKLFWQLKETLRHNAALSIDWGAQSKPTFLNEDADGNLDGTSFTRQELSNAIGSLNWIQLLLDNGSLTGAQGDHLGNLEKLTRPNV
jgi:hypothetical protein